MVLNSRWATNPLTLDESLNDAAWAGSMPQKLPVAGGNIWLYLRNDAHFMYLAIDLPDETASVAAGDYFWLSFDINKNSVINPNQDINYGTLASTYPGKVVRQYYLGPSTWTGINGQPGSYKTAFEGSPKNSASHKVWKMKIPLADFGINLAALNIVAWFGLRMHSGTHSYDFPASFFGSGFNQMSTSVMVFARNATIDPALMGPVIAAVGLIPTAASVIDPATGRATTAAGYYVPAYKAAFGGSLNLIFNHNTVGALYAAGARKYKVRFGTVSAGTELSSAWYNYRWVGNEVVLDAFGPDAGGFYTLPDPASQYSIEDLLMQFNSALLPNGLYHFAVEFFTAGNVHMDAPVQDLKLLIDNTVPVVNLDLIAKSSAPTVNFPVCEFANLAPGEGLVFRMTATDPEGDISSYGLNYAYGNGSGGSIWADSFGSSKPPGWTGVSNFAVPTSPSPWIPPATCAYAFTVYAYARTTNGYGYIGYNSYMRMITIIKH